MSKRKEQKMKQYRTLSYMASTPTAFVADEAYRHKPYEVVPLRRKETTIQLEETSFYKCDPEKNTGCCKRGCYINGGDCYLTTDANCALL